MATENGRNLSEMELVVEVGRSQFCLVPAGQAAHSRLKLDMQYGCIPIIVSEDTQVRALTRRYLMEALKNSR